MNNIKISLRNYSKDKERYKKYRKQLLEILKRVSADFSIEITVLVKILDLSKGYTLDGKSARENIAYVLMKKDYAMLSISSSVFDMFENNQELDLEIVLYHEFIHMYDLTSISHLSYFKNCSVDEINLNTKQNYNIKAGIHFWSEFIAYLKTYQNYRKWYKLYTNPCELEYIYLSIIDKLDIAKNATSYKKKGLLIKDIFETIDIFAYNFALYIASMFGGDRRRIKDKGKYYNKDSMEVIMKIIDDLVIYIRKLIHTLNTNKFVKNLEKLGHYINYKIYNRFGCKIKKDNGNYIMAFNMKQLEK